MQKIYGFKEQDIIALAKFINEEKNQNLSKTFEKFAIISKKAKGTIRNMYYAMTKLSKTDLEFTSKYLNGTPLSVAKIKEFSKEEEDKLVKNILDLKNKGISVRRAVNMLANNDPTLALRYQNKYRNALKKSEIYSNEKAKNGYNSQKESKLDIKNLPISEVEYARLKREINALYLRVWEKLRKENATLKKRISYLESENLKLLNTLYSSSKAVKGITLTNSILNKVKN